MKVCKENLERRCSMKKEEILNASRKEHRNKDLAEMEVHIKQDVTQAELVP